jgi:GNAT superfamily N-acetyltransferase
MIEISVKGKWIKVPSFQWENSTIVITGSSIKTARVHDEAWIGTELKDPDLCLRKLREAGHRADLFTFTQMPPGRPPEYEYQCEPDSIALIRLTNFNDWWEGLPQETRKNVRRAEKRGVRVEAKAFDYELVQNLVELNNSSPIRQGRRYPHYGKSFDETKRDYCSFADRSDFLCAYFEDEFIGFLKVVYREQVASVLNLCTKESHQDKRPANALINVAVERCAARGISYLTYGFFNYGNKRDTQITQFKIRNGFEEALIPRYFVPLTVWGQVYIRFGFHRGMLGMFPNRVILTSLTVRAKSYQVWMWLISRCSSMLERPNCDRQMGR